MQSYCICAKVGADFVGILKKEGKPEISSTALLFAEEAPSEIPTVLLDVSKGIFL